MDDRITRMLMTVEAFRSYRTRIATVERLSVQNASTAFLFCHRKAGRQLKPATFRFEKAVNLPPFFRL